MGSNYQGRLTCTSCSRVAAMDGPSRGDRSKFADGRGRRPAYCLNQTYEDEAQTITQAGRGGSSPADIDQRKKSSWGASIEPCCGVVGLPLLAYGCDTKSGHLEIKPDDSSVSPSHCCCWSLASSCLVRWLRIRLFGTI